MYLITIVIRHLQTFSYSKSAIGIEKFKQIYYSRVTKKLIDPIFTSKSYRSNLNTFMDSIKFLCIHPMFKRKVYIYKHFSVTQCTLVENTNKLPLVFEIQTLTADDPLQKKWYWKKYKKSNP